MAGNDIPEENEDFKVFNDSVHGHMQMHPLCVKIIDTPEFQRLRNIKQLGTTYYVYPAASHNRFEHSLGVCYLAGEMVNALRINQKSLEINNEDKLCVQIAGLCHDLGHGPFSHLWECFLKQKGINWHHEENSVAMFDYLINKNNLITDFEKYGLNEERRKFITELILGEGDSCDKNKQFLFQIVCNKTNNIDVDKWDYFLRDGLNLNLKVSFDYTRLLKFCKVLEVEKKMHIVFRNKVAYDIYEMFLVRSTLHYRAYQHRVSLVIDRMITDAFEAADDYFILKSGVNSEIKLSKAHKYPLVWSRLTDSIFYDILWNSSEDLVAAQEILNRVLNRNLYKCVTSYNTFPTFDLWEKNNNWVDDMTKGIEKKLKNKFNNDSIEFAVVTSNFNFGSGSPDPLKDVYFYDEKCPEKAVEKDWSEINLFPATKKSPHHIELYIFCKTKEVQSKKIDDAKKLTHSFIDSFIRQELPAASYGVWHGVQST